MPTAGDRNRKTRMTTLITKFKISDLESPSNFQVKEKNLLKSVQKQQNYALIQNAKIVMFKMDVHTFWY